MTAQTTITIATWNLWRPALSSVQRNEAILRKMHDVHADIWILTETHEVIAPEGFHSVASPSLSWARLGEYTTMIWSRWEMTQIPTFPYLARAEEPAGKNPTYAVVSQAISPAVCARVALPGGSLLVYGTIITWPNDKGPANESGYTVEQEHAIVEHGRDWARLRKEFPDVPLCVGGDFNTTINGTIYPTHACRRLLQEALDGADLRCVTDTFDYNIDHICLSAAWPGQVTQVDQWQAEYIDAQGNGPKRVSDHIGVRVVREW